MNDRLPGTSYDNPIKYRDHWRIYVGDNTPYEYVHDDYDGAEDGRCGHGRTIAECKSEIDDMHYDGEEGPRNIHERFESAVELARTFAQDGAFRTSADRLKRLATVLEEWADECDERLRK